MNTVTLCGSAKFEQDFIEANKQLTLRGFVVHSLSCFPSQQGEKNWYTEYEKILLDLAHLNKILVTDAVLVVGSGYMGFSTAREVVWAAIHGKQILKQSHFDEGDWGAIARSLEQRHSSATILSDAQEILSGMQT